jgi:hypothetical protein
LRLLLAGGTAANRTAPSHEATFANRAAAAAQATIDFLDFFVGVAPSYEKAGGDLSPVFLFLQSLFLS